MKIKEFSTLSWAHGVWALTAVVSLAFAGGCGDSTPEGGMVEPSEGQVQAQNAMEDFMKKQGKTPNAKAAKAAKADKAAPAEPADAEAK